MKKIVALIGLFAVVASATVFKKTLDTMGWHMVGVPVEKVDVNSSTFGSNISVVWRWNEKTQSWEFFSSNSALRDVAKSIDVPIIKTLKKGDAVWIKNKAVTNLVFDDGIDNNCSDAVYAEGAKFYKLGKDGNVISDSSTVWMGLLVKDDNYNLNYTIAFERNKGGFKTKKSHADAVSYCEDLDFMGHTDWSLPTIVEAGSIFGSSGITSYFPYSISGYDIWSSSKAGSSDYDYFKIGSNGSISTGSELYWYTYKYLCIRKNQ